MLAAPMPPEEKERLASLRRMLLLSTPDEEAFERVTRIARQIFQTPIALVSLVDDERQWFKSCIGLTERETPREYSFCAHAIMGSELFVIEDARNDPIFSDNPLVSGSPNIVFYAGRPLRNSEGFLVGTLCIIDRRPRQLSAEQRQALDDLGHWLEQIFRNRELSSVQLEYLKRLEDSGAHGMLDPLLHIWQRPAIEEVLKQEILRAFHQKSPLTLLLIDVHGLADINQRHGREAGDAALVEISKVLRSVSRSYDSLGRYGDDEILAILPNADAAKAMKIADRLQQGIELVLLPGQEGFIELSVSIGLALANYTERTPDVAYLLACAETALHAAKGKQPGQTRLAQYSADAPVA